MMQRLIFDEDHEMFRDATRRFMQAEIEPHVERWRAQGICDREAFLNEFLGNTTAHVPGADDADLFDFRHTPSYRKTVILTV